MKAEPLSQELQAEADGDFVASVTLSIMAIWTHAVEILADRGAYNTVISNYLRIAIDAGTDNPLGAVDLLLDHPFDRFTVAAQGGVAFIEQSAPPPAGMPLPEAHAAAMIVVQVFLFAKRIRSLHRRLRRREMDLQHFAELMLIGMRIGAVSDAFHPDNTSADAKTVAEAKTLLDRQKDAREEGAATMKAKKEAWMKLALPVARTARKKNPQISVGDIAVAIRLGVKSPFRTVLKEGGPVVLVNVPEIGSLEPVIRDWQKEWTASNGKRGLKPLLTSQA